MSQRPLATIPTASTQPYRLPSALAAALSSLDVNLEEELIRYRRHRAGEPPPPPQGLERDRDRKPLDLMSVTVPLTTETLHPLTGLTSQTPGEIASQTPTESDATAATLREPAVRQPVDSSQPANSSSTALSTLSTNKESLELATSKKESETNRENASLAPLTKPSKPGNLVTPIAAPNDPDDYLESSEELLKSLAEDEDDPGDRSWHQSLLTPFGIGLMLLVLMVCAILGVLANPSTRHLLTDGSFNAQTPTTDKNPTAPSPTVGIPQTPNLADREFTPITLDTLSALETNPSPVSVPIEPTPASYDPAASDPSTSQLQPTEDRYFYVVTPYDPTTLEQVRQIIPDAYARYDLPQGTQIQLGAFREEYRAEALAEELQNRGIAAAVYKP